MPPEAGARALSRFQAELSEAKQRDVLEAVQEFAGDPSQLTVAGISRAANVSRQFIHSHAHLHHAIQEQAKKARRATARPVLPDGGGSVEGLKADRATLLAHVERQRTQIAEQQTRLEKFDEQRRRWLGSQLQHVQAVDPDVHAELRLTNERLMSENNVLTRKVAELRRLLDVATADLAAFRDGWAEDIKRLTKDDQKVVLLDRARGK